MMLSGAACQWFDVVEEIHALRQIWRIQRRWRTTFASGWSDWHGIFGDREWHVLSSRCVPHVSGGKAIAEYESRVCSEVVISERLDDAPAYRCVGGRLPTYSELQGSWHHDLYIIAGDWSWTFVMTHEDLYGPYFVDPSSNPRA